MSCNDNCFDIQLPPNIVAPSESALLISQSSDNDVHDKHYIYKPLRPWQTRIIRLHPATRLHSTGSRETQLHADLLIVNLHSIEGVAVEGTEEILSYRALSYSWGHPVLDDVLICDGAVRPISQSNATALRALRHDSKPVFLWIDAICINQEDDQEKSEQVASMLVIYKKAQSVIAWLGELDADSSLALACVAALPSLERGLSDNPQQRHSVACLGKLKDIHAALLGFYGRPLLGRTWVRQEIYAARQLVVQCGLVKIAWEDFIKAAGLIPIISPLLADEDDVRRMLELRVSSLLAEAQKNTLLPLSGIKPPRSLIEVLLQSKDFDVSDEKDTFYAILGMCNVDSFTKDSVGDQERSQNGVLVDYSKSTVKVLQDASLYLMNRRNDPAALVNLWHSYRRGDEHSRGLASWAVDWRSGTFDDAYRATLQNSMRTREEYFAREFKPGLSLVGICLHLCFAASGNDVSSYVTADIDLAGHWVPLWSTSDHGQGPRSTETPDVSELVPNQVLTLSDPLQSDRSVIYLKARALNYVAYLTEYTCDLDHFLNSTDNFHRTFIGLEGLSIHARKLPRKNHTFLTMAESRCDSLTVFETALHPWRLAILGVGNDAQVSLVPSTAKKGDIVVAIAPGMLPMLMRPLQSHTTAGGLFPEDDPYEQIPHGTPYVKYERVVKVPSILLPLFLLGFHPALTLVPNESAASTAVLVCYGIIIPPCLACSLWMIHFSSRRTYTHPLALPYTPGPQGIPGWEGLMFLLTVISFPVCIRITTGPLQTVLIVYFCLTIGSLLVGNLWLYQRHLSDSITIARRRTQVFADLDKVSETLGPDFEFLGPMFVKTDREYWSFPFWLDHRIFRRCFFRIVVWANSCLQSEPRLKISDMDWFFTEVYTSRGGYHHHPRRYPWHNDRVRAWDRPPQQFKMR